MCVIFVTDPKNPKRVPEDMLRAGYTSNPHKGGIMWCEGDEVVWEKGLDADQLVDRSLKVPLPYAVHCRIPSCGADVAKLNHPFPCARTAPLLEKGRFKGPVLMHNGHWASWQTELSRAAYTARLRVPGDDWTDSRVMAWLVGNFGIGILATIDPRQRIVTFGPKEDIETFGEGWKWIDGILCSNDFFIHNRRRFLRGAGWSSEAGDSDTVDLRSHPPASTPTRHVAPGVVDTSCRMIPGVTPPGAISKPILTAGEAKEVLSPNASFRDRRSPVPAGDQGESHADQQKSVEEGQKAVGEADGEEVALLGDGLPGESAERRGDRSRQDRGGRDREATEGLDPVRDMLKWARSLNPKGMNADRRARLDNAIRRIGPAEL